MQKLKEFLKKVQNLPEKKRKIIFWTIIVILGITLLTFYINNINQRIKNFSKEKLFEELKIPDLKEDIKSLSPPTVEENFKDILEKTKTNEK